MSKLCRFEIDDFLGGEGVISILRVEGGFEGRTIVELDYFRFYIILEPFLLWLHILSLT